MILKTPMRPHPGRSHSKNLSQMSVLIADGQDFFLHQVRRALTRVGVGHIHLAKDGPEALSIVRGYQPHLAVIDWDLPSISGRELVSFLRHNEVSPAPNLPVLMTMASASRDQVIQAREAGVNEVLVKPVTAENLMPRMLWALSQSPQPAKAKLAKTVPTERIAGWADWADALT